MRRTILVTGFGSFPGTPRNPTQSIVAGLHRHSGRLKRLGADLRCAIVPVRYGELQGHLDRLIALHRPDVILHFGVAGRRRRISVETRGENRARPFFPDASGRYPEPILVAGGPRHRRASLDTRRLHAALRRAGFPVELSHDAGAYVCNAILFRSLATNAASEIGFIHVPRPRARGLSAEKRAAAALLAILTFVRRPPATQLTGFPLADRSRPEFASPEGLQPTAVPPRFAGV